MSLSFLSRGICNRAPFFRFLTSCPALFVPGMHFAARKGFPATPLLQHSSPNSVALGTIVRPLNDVVREGFLGCKGWPDPVIWGRTVDNGLEVGVLCVDEKGNNEGHSWREWFTVCWREFASVVLNAYYQAIGYEFVWFSGLQIVPQSHRSCNTSLLYYQNFVSTAPLFFFTIFFSFVEREDYCIKEMHIMQRRVYLFGT